jgi:hypothetical protein
MSPVNGTDIIPIPWKEYFVFFFLSAIIIFGIVLQGCYCPVIILSEAK